MKKLRIVLGLLVLAIIVSSCTTTGSNVPTLSNVVVREIGNVKLHSFMSSSVTPVIIETRRALIIIDFPGDNEANVQPFKDYVDSFRKPIERYFISHVDRAHWLGVEKAFPNQAFHSIDANAIRAVAEGANIPVTPIADDSRLAVSGVNLVFQTDRAIGAYIIKMPDLKAVYHDHLGYVRLNVLIAPLEPRLAHLKALDREGYTWHMPGHGAPMQGPEFVNTVERFYGDVLAAVRRYSTVEEVKAAIIAAYPDYNTPAMLDRFLPGLMGR
jgi:hypothetical protein